MSILMPCDQCGGINEICPSISRFTPDKLGARSSHNPQPHSIINSLSQIARYQTEASDREIYQSTETMSERRGVHETREWIERDQD